MGASFRTIFCLGLSIYINSDSYININRIECHTPIVSICGRQFWYCVMLPHHCILQIESINALRMTSTLLSSPATFRVKKAPTKRAPKSGPRYLKSVVTEGIGRPFVATFSITSYNDHTDWKLIEEKFVALNYIGVVWCDHQSLQLKPIGYDQLKMYISCVVYPVELNSLVSDIVNQMEETVNSVQDDGHIVVEVSSFNEVPDGKPTGVHWIDSQLSPP
jgi:hypothetical protein